MSVDMSERSDGLVYHARTVAVLRAFGSFGQDSLLIRIRGTLKSWRSVLPFRGKSKSITIRHSDLRQSLRIHDLLVLNDAVLI